MYNMIDSSIFRYPFYILGHPIEGYEELRWNKKGSLLISNIILFLWFFAVVFAWQDTGFIFNGSRPDKLNILLILSSTIGLFALWAMVNWSLCTLMDGEGRFKDIWVISSYALLPYVLISYIITILSNILVLDEGVFLQYLNIIAVGWSICLLVSGMKVIHQYSLKKTIISLFFTLLGMSVVIILAVLVLSLFMQVYGFFNSIYSEIRFRL